MLYITESDLLAHISNKQLIQLTNDTANPVAVGSVILEAAAADAVTLIHSEFFEDYTLPFNPIPEIIKSIAARLTVVNLWKRRNTAEIPESVLTLETVTLKQLSRLREIGIDGAVPKTATPVASTVSNKTESDRVFNKSFINTFLQ